MKQYFSIYLSRFLIPFLQSLCYAMIGLASGLVMATTMGFNIPDGFTGITHPVLEYMVLILLVIQLVGLGSGWIMDRVTGLKTQQETPKENIA